MATPRKTDGRIVTRTPIPVWSLVRPSGVRWIAVPIVMSVTVRFELDR
jgi:hypothetical protein